MVGLYKRPFISNELRGYERMQLCLYSPLSVHVLQKNNFLFHSHR